MFLVASISQKIAKLTHHSLIHYNHYPLLDYEHLPHSTTHGTCPKLLRKFVLEEGLTFRPIGMKNFVSCSKLQDNITYNSENNWKILRKQAVSWRNVQN